MVSIDMLNYVVFLHCLGLVFVNMWVLFTGGLYIEVVYMVGI